MPSLPLRILLTAYFAFVTTTLVVAQEPKPLAAAPESRTPDLFRQFNTSLEALVAKVSPAVVQIQVTGVGPLTGSGKSGVAFIARQRAIGSGVIVDPDGYIMTNAHVVEGAQRIRVVLPMPPSHSLVDLAPYGRGQVLDAKLVGLHKDTDLALLKVEGHKLPFLRLGTTQPVHTGEIVLAIGSPEGLESSVTMGVVSSAWRQPDPDQPMVYIQTDAPINPGNSGGPLVNLDGDVIGLNTFILSEGGGSEGLGFAIPARIVGFVYANLRKYGHVHRTEIQVGAQTVTPTLAAGLGLAQNWGVVVSDVIPKGPADAAGLKVQDIVVAIDGRPILGLPGLTAALYLHPVDQVVRLEVLRGNQKISLNVPAIEDQDKEDHLADFIDPEQPDRPARGLRDGSGRPTALGHFGRCADSFRGRGAGAVPRFERPHQHPSRGRHHSCRQWSLNSIGRSAEVRITRAETGRSGGAADRALGAVAIRGFRDGIRESSAPEPAAIPFFVGYTRFVVASKGRGRFSLTHGDPHSCDLLN